MIIDYSEGTAEAVARLLPAGTPRSIVDIGAGDGIAGSVSRSFVESGFEALLVEPDAKLFKRLEENSRNQANVRVVQAFVDGESRDGMISRVTRSTSVTLNDLLARESWPSDFGVLHVNTPGREFAVLSAFDFARFHPAVIVSSDSESGGEARRPRYELLIASGYLFCGSLRGRSLWRGRSLDGIFAEPSLAAPRTLRDLPAAAATCRFDKPVPVASGACGPVLGSRLPWLTVEGWATDAQVRSVPEDVWLSIVAERDGHESLQPCARVPRPDVAAHYRNGALLLAGFRGRIRIADLAPGRYLLSIVQSDGSRTLRAGTRLTLEVGADARDENARGRLAEQFLDGSGIEIGALQRPLSVPPECSIRYIDRLGTRDLRDHYPELAGMQITAPDLVDDGEQLRCIGTGTLDFVIANHFLEHSLNPIQTLRNLLRLLRQSGVLYLAIPDRRYTFDFARPVTPYEKLRDAAVSGTRADTREQYLEWCRLVTRLRGEDAEREADRLLAQTYSIHFNVWTIDELLDFLLRARREFALPFNVASVVASDNEVITILRKT